MSNGNGPDPALFLKDANSRLKGQGKWQQFIGALEPMVAVRMPYVGTKRPRTALNTAARNLGVRVVIRTFDGEAWACLIPDDEVAK